MCMLCAIEERENDQVRGHFQVPVCKSYLDPLSLATWMCFLATLQCAVMAFFLEANYMEIWKLASIWELPCILYGVSFGPFKCTHGMVIHMLFWTVLMYNELGHLTTLNNFCRAFSHRAQTFLCNLGAYQWKAPFTAQFLHRWARSSQQYYLRSSFTRNCILGGMSTELPILLSA